MPSSYCFSCSLAAIVRPVELKGHMPVSIRKEVASGMVLHPLMIMSTTAVYTYILGSGS